MHSFLATSRRNIGHLTVWAGMIAFLIVLVFSERASAISLRLKLEMLGYSDTEIAAIISGKERREDIDRKIRMNMLCLHVPAPPLPSAVLNKNEPATLSISEAQDLSKRTSLGSLDGSHKRQVPFHHNERQYLPIIRSAAEKCQIDETLIMAVIKVESNFNPEAISPKGAMGLMQLVPSTASLLGVVDPFNPQENIHGGAKYLSQCIDLFQDIELALAAYNAGPHLVGQLRKVPPYAETKNFIKDVFFYKKLYDQML